ncbi:MAG: DoxX family protein [Steroidobacteraceae bacterium]
MLLLRYDFLVGRVLVSLLFIITALLLMFRPVDFKYLESLIRSRGVPLAKLAMVLTIILELACGVMILVGWQTWIAAAILIVWMIPATLVVHAPWKAPPEMQSNEIYHTLKNIAIAGGLLILVAAYRS